MEDIQQIAKDDPIVHQCLRMRKLIGVDEKYMLAVMTLSLSKALKESQEKHLDAEKRAWPRVMG